MHIVITGASGLIGKQLVFHFLNQNHKITIIGRKSLYEWQDGHQLPCDYLSWRDLDSQKILALKNADVIIHLAGDNIGSGRWTEKKKKNIYESRIQLTQKFIQRLDENKIYPKLFISSSAIGIYGNQQNTILREDAPIGEDYLAQVCSEWELASHSLRQHTRVVNIRTGVVLSNEGGFLTEIEDLFLKGIGGVIGDGQQYLSWIHIDDLVQVYSMIIELNNISGPINATTPNPITNRDWTQHMAQTLNVKVQLPTPKLPIKLLLGEKSTLVLGSQNVIPQVLLNMGFKFKYPDFQSAIQQIYTWKASPYERRFTATQWINTPLEKCFSFFSATKNLEEITPLWLNLKIESQSTKQLQKDTQINYSLKIHGVPARWQTLISLWEPPHQFIDVQLKGPYKKWHHTHYFSEFKGGTLISDEVIYQLPFGYFGNLLASSWVDRDIRKIFNFRRKIITQQLALKK